MSVAGRGECEVALVDFGILGLLEGAEHEVAEDALFGFALYARGEFLVHLRGDDDFFSDFVGFGGDFFVVAVVVAAFDFAAVAFHLEFFDG